MIIEGKISGIGSGQKNLVYDWMHVGYLEFDDRDDLRSEKRRVSFPAYLYDKLTGNYGQHIKLVMAANFVVVAMKVGNKVYKIENSQDFSAARKISMTPFDHLVSVALITSTLAGFFPSLAIWYFLKTKKIKQIRSLSNSLS
jgi:hypothetical protein